MSNHYNPSQSAAARGALGTVGAVLAGVGALGTLIFSIVASFAEPRWTPAFEVVDLQAHESGRYYVKYSFLATWFLTLAVAFAVAALAWMLVRAAVATVRTASGRPFHDVPTMPEGPQWQVMHQRSRARSLLIGAAMLAPSMPFLGVFFADATSLYPLGLLGTLLLIVAPMLYMAGQVLLLDGMFLPQAHHGVIEGLEVRRDQRGRTLGHDLLSGGRRWSVPEGVFARLRPGMPFALYAAHVTGSVLELRVSQPMYR